MRRRARPRSSGLRAGKVRLRVALLLPLLKLRLDLCVVLDTPGRSVSRASGPPHLLPQVAGDQTTVRALLHVGQGAQLSEFPES
jgi:hypothetical protein